MLRVFFSLLVARLTRMALRLTKRGGTALPGKLALKLCPDLLSRLSRNVTTVIVTGTNGKTTSCRMVEQLFAEAGLPYFANKGGANLKQGITTEFAMNATLFGKAKKSYAVIECDEAAMVQVCPEVKPKVILLTNVFSDQLDRFGDVLTTLSAIKRGMASSPDSILCLNADCSLSCSIAEELSNPVLYYGVECPVYKEQVQEQSDAPRCLHCGSEYTYTLRTYGHLGSFHCPICGYKRPAAAAAVTSILHQGADSTQVLLRLGEREVQCEIAVPGGYNIYNAAGASAVGMALELDGLVICAALANFHCGFGRMEKMNLNGLRARMILVKNPAGCNQTLNFLANIEGDVLFVVALNDRVGDGTDISWIYDADFEKLLCLGNRLKGIYCAGERGADMAVRLKYAGFPLSKLRVFADYDQLIDAFCAQTTPLVMMPTYSAMMDLRSALAKRFGLKEFWE